MQAVTDAPIYDTAAAEKLCEKVRLVLTTHELQYPVPQLFLPMIPEVGYSGTLRLLGAIYRRLCSRKERGGLTYV